MATTSDLLDPPMAPKPSAKSRFVDIPEQAPYARMDQAGIDQNPIGVGSRDNRLRIAMLTNAYPKVSHSFIRSEVLALERMGFAVERITVRRAAEPLVDMLDRREQTRTTILLDGAWGRLAVTVLRRAIVSPRRFATALFAAVTSAIGAAGLLRNLAYLAEACRLATMLERKGIRHVHVHFGTNPAMVARLASKLAPITYSLTIHGPEEFDAPQALRLSEKIADAAFVAAVSDYGRAQLLRWADSRFWSRITVVRCGADEHFLKRPVPQSVDGLRSRRFLCVARLSAQKGIPLLIEAVDLLRDLNFEVRIIGDGELRDAIEAQIAARNLASHIRLLGWQDRETIANELISARAFVLPSLAEGLPVVLMEALALRRPVIATAIAGIPELVDHETGWLIPAGSPEALASAMRAALSSSTDILASMGTLGRERVLKDHNTECNAGRLARLFRPLA